MVPIWITGIIHPPQVIPSRAAGRTSRTNPPQLSCAIFLFKVQRLAFFKRLGSSDRVLFRHTRVSLPIAKFPDRESEGLLLRGGPYENQRLPLE
jgi:hypothetical protein